MQSDRDYPYKARAREIFSSPFIPQREGFWFQVYYSQTVDFSEKMFTLHTREMMPELTTEGSKKG